MADEDVTIGLKTEGAAEAVREIDKVVDAKRELEAPAAPAPGNRGFDGMLDNSPPREDEAMDPEKIIEQTKALDERAEVLGETQDLLEGLAGTMPKVTEADLEAARAANTHQDAMRQLVNLQRALVAIDAAKTIIATARALDGVAPAGSDAARGLDAAEASMNMLIAGVQTFLATGNPLAATLATVASGVAGVVEAYGAMRTAQARAENAEKIFQETMVDSATIHREVARSIRADDLTREFTQQASAASKVTDELSRQNDVARARNELETARARAGGTADSDIAVMRAEQVATQKERELAAAQELARLAQVQARIQQQVVDNLPTSGAPIREIEAQKEKLIELEAAATRAVADFVTLQEVSSLNIQTAGVEATEKVTAEAERVLKEQFDSARQIMIDAMAQPGARVDALAMDVKRLADEVMADGLVKLEESNKVALITKQLSQSAVIQDRQATVQLQRLLAVIEKEQAGRAALDARIAAIEARANSGVSKAPLPIR
jgi:hypothetical protein